ncbi:PBP superfamily domain-containing protein [Streptomyces sp. TLI_053]|uniref:substrate-binding domain-containing protein n=1 Tax=Streptomyces sp. TLI_053 TaxID=1855352 RepID=UPI00087CABAD|nr:substrate-binding domain-containing protein [Streptomyces sp. TLI_053]SDT71379.1 PBP superfamily domain-containing protein [Streptomyces sp. TLI_053]
MRKTAAKLLAAAAIATSVATVAAGTAVADPSTLPTLPVAQDIVGVGSDTTQAVLNQFSTDYNAFLGASSTLPRLYSWDATGTSPIVTKTGAQTSPAFARPNGSSAGIKALENSTDATVNFARSSRAPQATDQPSDLFVAFAKDAVSVATTTTGSNAPTNLSKADLINIYNCTYTNWNQIPGYTGAGGTIKPFLPQVGSGTRSFFLGTLGLANGGACVLVNPLVQENQGTDPVLNDPNAIVPYSAAHYIGQVYNGHSSGSDAAGNLTIRSIDGISPIDATNGLAKAFADTSFGRVVYNVVRATAWTATDTQGTALRAIFGTNGWICKNATAAADIKSYGFRALPAGACGSTIHS